MSEVHLADFTDRGGAASDPEVAPHPGGSSGESHSSDNEAVFMTRTAEAVNYSDDEDCDETPQNRSKKRVNKLLDSDSETEDHNSPTNNEGKVKSPVQSDGASRSQNLANRLLDSDSDVENDNTTTSNKGKIKSAKSSVHSSDSSDEAIRKTVPSKSRIKTISSSDSGSDSGSSRSKGPTIEQSDNNNDKTSPLTKRVTKKLPNSDSSDSDDIYEKTSPKTIKVTKKLLNSDSSNSDSETGPSKYEEQKTRMKEKRNKLQQKFKSLVTSRVKETKSANGHESKKGSSSGSEQEDKSGSCNSDDEASSIEKIKQKIKERTLHLKSTIYDRDTSSDEEAGAGAGAGARKHVHKLKKPLKSNQSTLPKPVRMSAKQAMENMQKIKSESNRMLREKEVSLPYHRPKALSLKDIMSKRRPALTPDGKALPIKMSEEQLKLYAQSLEQRQKEVIELCKSDTDDECDDNAEHQPATEIENQQMNKEEEEEMNVENKENKDNNLETNIIDSKTDPQPDMTSQNDTLFDTLADEINNSTVDDTKITSEDKKGAIICKTNEIESTTEKQNDTEIPSNIVDEGALNNKTGENNEECAETDMALVYNDSVESMDTSVDKPKETEEPNKLENTEPNNSEIIESKQSQNIEHSDKLENSEPNDSELEIIESKPIQNTSGSGKNGSVNIDSNTIGTEVDSQLISLHYDTEPLQEKPEVQNEVIENSQKDITSVKKSEDENVCDDNKDEMMETEELDKSDEQRIVNGFSDDDIDMTDIDELIENAEIISSQTNNENFDSPMLIKDPRTKTNPKLTGAPGMIIDLDGTDPTHRKLTGVQLLKERFSYFSKLKTPEEMERDREKKLKPGNKHQILKQELEDQIAEQRSLEWSKRLEAEKQLHKELELKEENQGSDEEDIDKIEEKLEGDGDIKDSSGESEPEENDCDMTDKPIKRNPMLADEAEESDCDEDENPKADEYSDKGEDANDEDNGEDDSEEEESSEPEEEEEQTTNNPKKGRILKAFEDSDEEADKQELAKADVVNVENAGETNEVVKESPCVALKNTQDDDLQLAQHVKYHSEDLFASQESTLGEDLIPAPATKTSRNDQIMGTQTFSIAAGDAFQMPDKLSICDSQLSQDGNLEAVVGMCSGSFSQAIPLSQFPSQLPESQVIGDDVLALCTGKFYDNPFVSQNEAKQQNDEINEEKSLKNYTIQNSKVNGTRPKQIQKENEESVQKDSKIQDVTIELTDLKDTRPITDSMELNDTDTKEPKDDVLESILDELNEPEKKPNKYFVGNKDKENKQNDANVQYKKKFVIDSDEEGQGEETGQRKKNLKKRKLEKRALQISDDESEQSDEGVEDEEHSSGMDEDIEERLVEYDSDENEVEIAPKILKKKQKAPEFFEQEAELTSEDEWIGSGDEDEAGLDRMEREEGDDDQFNQRLLQRELGQIHMRDVLDQDKREVRIIQELLFEDGDLGTGSRQRKFRWKNAEGEEETGTGTVVDALPDTQEQEFESEEQWRKQRHEREMFLRDMQKQNASEDLFDITTDQTLMKTGSVSNNTSLVQNASTDITTVGVEKTTAKDIPSPKKSAFTLFKQNYHGSLLTRGQGALARLAAIASPLAADEDASTVGSVASGRKRNFVFATLTQEDAEPKVTKRKAETNTGTPRLVKKLRTEDKPKHSKNSLLDHMKA